MPSTKMAQEQASEFPCHPSQAIGAGVEEPGPVERAAAAVAAAAAGVMRWGGQGPGQT